MSREGQDFGPTVVDGFVRRTSVSALTSFDPESYAGCPLRWWWQRVDGKKEEETKSQGLGKAIHAEVEEYEKTGNDGVLGPIARAGKHLLPRPGSDLIVEANFGDLAKALVLREARASASEIVKHAGLVAGNIPLDGYIDLRHARGEYVDASGLVHKEKPEHGKVVEVADHKSTSSIADYSKSPSEMAETPQMVGYANYVLNVDPVVDHVRVSHIYYQTRGPKIAKKITALLSANVAREKWRRVDQLAIYMEEVALAKRPEDVEGNSKSCEAYKGCPHVSYCPKSKRSFSAFSKQGDQRMSLFNTTSNGTPNGAPAPAPSGSLFGSIPKAASAPVAAPAQDRSAIDAEKARLAAEDAAVAYGFCNKCGSKLTSANASKTPNGSVVHIGCGVEANTVSPGQIVPNDAARPTFAQSAVPVPAGELVQVTDPEILRRAAEVQAAHDQQKAAAKTAPAAAKGGRCPSGGTELTLSQKEIVTRKTKCPGCGKGIDIKDDHFNASFTGMKIPSHNLPKGESVAPVVVAQPVAQAPAQQPMVAVTSPIHKDAVTDEPVQTTPFTPARPAQQPVEQAPTATAIHLFVDTVIERGARPTPLEDYYLPKVRELEEQHGAADIRCASNDTPLAYGKWKGALASYVRSVPPPPGLYFARSANEIEAVVIEALAPLCATVARGVR